MNKTHLIRVTSWNKFCCISETPCKTISISCYDISQPRRLSFSFFWRSYWDFRFLCLFVTQTINMLFRSYSIWWLSLLSFWSDFHCKFFGLMIWICWTLCFFRIFAFHFFFPYFSNLFLHYFTALSRFLFIFWRLKVVEL